MVICNAGMLAPEGYADTVALPGGVVARTCHRAEYSLWSSLNALPGALARSED
ncbi:hypothetical protein Nans01_19000 [Nocardiopsis ansamitocini]|uniref:Uncharacterized protein n=1 Tax=Nocardiopsis ansamitocini TaxID=1670832 RepID=A0A9W6P555_9ACTN|nr:hypothetical protein Nans01_19000 [Nocardiopsis ansamitocini]